MAPPIHFQFLNSAGSPLANGKIYTYAAGTTNLQNTYVDSSGVTQNADPILLDATGSPSNGSVQTGIFLSNTSWKFVAFDVNNVQQWSVDNVTTYFALLNSANTWTATQTFAGQLIDTLTDNQMAMGSAGNQTTLDFPPPFGNVTLHFPSIADTVVARTTFDTLTNKTLTIPNLNTPLINGVLVSNGPGTYALMANANPTGTTTSTLTKLLNAPSQATIAATTDTSGIVGICAASCGATGNAEIQQSGQGYCLFDGATIAGDYVQISATVGGDCHDAGAAYPAAGQIIGRVLTTNGGASLDSLFLFGPEIKPSGATTICAVPSTTSVNANVTTAQTIQACAFNAGALNVLGKTFVLTANGQVAPNGGASNNNASWGTANNSATLTVASAIASETSSASSYTFTSSLYCTVQATGASGTLSCGQVGELTGSSATLSQTIFNITGVNLTGAVDVGVTCSFSVASASNNCSNLLFVLQQLN